MIPQPRFLDIAKAAHTAVENFSSQTGVDPRTLLSPFPGRRPTWATRFAQRIGGMSVTTKWRRLPLPNFASWLVLLPSPAIAVDAAQVADWYERPQNLSPVHPDIQVTRAVVHEVGHKLLHPRLLAPRVGAALVATAEEEEEACVFAMVAMAVVLGNSAWYSRTTSSQDDSPSIPI